LNATLRKNTVEAHRQQQKSLHISLKYLYSERQSHEQSLVDTITYNFCHQFTTLN